MKFDKIENHVSGRRVLHHVVLEKTWDILEDNGIKDSDFRGKAKITLDFIRDYFNDSDGEFPPEDFVVEETNIPWPSTVAVHAALKRFKDWRLTREIAPLVDRAQEELAKQRPREAIQVLNGINTIEGLDSGSGLLDVNETAEERYEEYVASKSEEVGGILPPFQTWRDALLAFENGTLNTILALSSRGKSWISAYSAVHAAYVEGKKVLLVSCENSTASMAKRIDSLHSQLDYGDLRAKILDSRMEKKWKANAAKMSQEEGNIQIADMTVTRNVHDVYQQCLIQRPDFVIIDGVYKLSGTDWQEVASLLQSLCNYATLSKVPWLITSQLNKKANEATNSTDRAYSASGSKNFYTDSATLLTITQSPELEMLNNVIECNVDKIRENGQSGNFKKQFYLQMDMSFSTIREFSFDTFEDEEAMSLTK